MGLKEVIADSGVTESVGGVQLLHIDHDRPEPAGRGRCGVQCNVAGNATRRTLCVARIEPNELLGYVVGNA
ncbi:unannotated protein [freshwater metagenome]|uniref:Unannotated protein n=1 Tax=freshwater metagenome TaxID=449393 RepID=A0A6J6ZXR6_9ZZZZ